MRKDKKKSIYIYIFKPGNIRKSGKYNLLKKTLIFMICCSLRYLQIYTYVETQAVNNVFMSNPVVPKVGARVLCMSLICYYISFFGYWV